jgi:two-component sensor histidine kinase
VQWGTTKGTDAENPRFHLRWRENGGPEVRTPSRRGFGSTMVERFLAAYFRGEASIAYPPEGVVFTLDCPLAEAGKVTELA